MKPGGQIVQTFLQAHPLKTAAFWRLVCKVPHDHHRFGQDSTVVQLQRRHIAVWIHLAIIGAGFCRASEGVCPYSLSLYGVCILISIPIRQDVGKASCIGDFVPQLFQAFFRNREASLELLRKQRHAVFFQHPAIVI